MDTKNRIRLVVNADDFGLNSRINRAVALAASDGILTSASMMMTGAAITEAVELAGQLPELHVGLHVALTGGSPCADKRDVNLLLDKHGRLGLGPAFLGLKLQFSAEVAQQIKIEVASQFKKFTATGLPLTHVDCHHHLQVHPRLFDIISQLAGQYGVRTIRIPMEPWSISARLSTGHMLRNRMYRIVFGLLAQRCRGKAAVAGLRYIDGVLGLYQTGEVNETWLLDLLDHLPERGIFELYAHPEIGKMAGERELGALISQPVRKKIDELGIGLITYDDL